MIAIPNIEKPKQCIKELDCDLLDEPCLFIDERNACLLQEDSKIGEYEQNYKTCPLIEIAEPTETLIHDIKKLIAFIDPHMIIASTYAEQIERAEAVKKWLLSIVGERRTDETIESITFKKMVKAVKEEMREVQNFTERRNDGTVCSYGVPANADQHTQSVESVEQEEWIDWREEQEFEDRWERRTDE